MKRRNKEIKSTGDNYLDTIIISLGVSFTDQEIDALHDLRGTRLNDMGLRWFFDGLFAMYRVKSDERLVLSNRFHSLAMIALTAGLFFVGVIELITHLLNL